MLYDTEMIDDIFKLKMGLLCNYVQDNNNSFFSPTNHQNHLKLYF